MSNPESSSLLPASASYLDPPKTSLSLTAQAAWHTENAMLGLPPSPSIAARTQSNRDDYLKFQTSQRPEREIALAILIILTFLEAPLWCTATATSSDPLSVLSVATCTLPNSPQIYLTSTLPHPPPLLTTILELSCYTFLLHLVHLNIKASFSLSNFLADKLAAFRAIITLVAAIDSIVFMFNISTTTVRVAPYVRFLLVALLPSVHTVISQSLSILPAFLPVLSLLLLTIAFFGWIFAMFLDDLTTTPIPRCAADETCPTAADKFGTLHTAIYSLAIVASGADTPDTQIPSYAANPLFGLLWFLFYALVNFLATNVVLGVVYQKYQERMKYGVLAFFRNRATGLKLAYNTITATPGAQRTHGVTRAQLEALIVEINLSEVIPFTPLSHVDFLFSGMDADNSGYVDFSEFLKICFALQESYVRVPSESYAQRTHPALWTTYNLDRVKRFVTDETSYMALPTLVRLTLAVNSLFILAESYQDLSHDDALKEHMLLKQDTWGYLNLAFSLLYTIELALKLTTIPFTKYWLYARNKFDCTITLLLLLISLLWLLPFVHISPETLRFFSILRLLRLLELIGRLPTYTFIVECVAYMARGCVPVILTVATAAGLWCVLGVQMWGGMVHADNPLLKDSDYFSDNFDVFNFNDMSMGMMTFLAILVSAGPLTQVTDAFATLSSVPLSVAFFFSYYYVNVLVLLNVFVSFVVDAFLSQYQLKEQAKDDRSKKHRSASVVGRDLGEEEVEEGWEVIKFDSNSTDALYTSMFEAELTKIIGGDDGDDAKSNTAVEASAGVAVADEGYGAADFGTLGTDKEEEGDESVVTTPRTSAS